MPDEKPDFLICARADQPIAVRNSDFSRVCSRCSSHIMIAPSGQRVLLRFPDLALICLCCYSTMASADDEHRLTDHTEVIRQELDTAIPNTWKVRN